MFEKVNPSHPDKVADRIAGAIIDRVFEFNPADRCAVEVLIGHGECHVIAETTSKKITQNIIRAEIKRIAPSVDYGEVVIVPQDKHLSDNQEGEIRCGDNGIFKGVPTSNEEMKLSAFAKNMYEKFPTDGKFIFDEQSNKLIVCQSCTNGREKEIRKIAKSIMGDSVYITINPLGDWIGGLDVDTGATNRKLGSDMGRAVTGGGLHGKDLSKADVTLNIYAYLLAQQTGIECNIMCAIGDTAINGELYADLVKKAQDYILCRGGFEKFAEWGLI